jgi:membrane protease YdiL (CAAX protease family)
VIAIRALLFDTSAPLWRACLLAFPIAMIPSVVLFAFAYTGLRALGVDVARIQPPEVHATVADAFGAIVFSPIVETLILAVGLAALSSFTNRRLPVAVVSAIAWGCLHGLVRPMWFFGTVWSFFVFSLAYLTWRERGFGRALMVAAVPHALMNLTVIVAAFISGRV